MSINVITEDRASGAQIVDGSLKFDRSKSTFLYRVFTSAGNRRTWTWAGWLKASPDGNYKRFWGVGGDSSPSVSQNYYRHNNTGTLTIGSDTDSTHKITSQNLRDTGWYHVVIIQDTTDATADDRLRLYLNGERVTSFSTDNDFGPNAESTINNAIADGNYHALGCTISNGDISSPTEPFDGAMSQVYFIDGQALTPDSFGFTDPLTNTWRPKKFVPTKINNGTTWSDATVSGSGSIDGSYPLTNAFNGSSSGNNVRSSGANTDITITFPRSIPFNSSIRIYQNQNGTAKINNESTVSTSSGGVNWVTVYSGSGTFSSLTLTSTGGDTVSLYEIEVDGVPLLDGDTANVGVNGFYLPMDGNSPIGLDRSNVGGINDGTVWSSSLTCSNGFNASAGESWGNDATADKAFDGLENTYAQPNGASNDHPLIFVTSISNISSMRVKYKGRLHLNDGSELASTSSDGVWYTVSSPPATLTKIQVFPYTVGAIGGRLYAVEINGTILKDGNSWTPVNFGGSAEIDKATGALPILNTTQGGTQAGVGVRPVSEGFPNAVINDGRVWSSSTTGSFNSGAGQGAGKAFNGTTSGTDYAAAAASSTAVFTNMGITGITKIRLSIAKNNTSDPWGNLILNDGSSNTNLQSWLQSNYSGANNSASFIDVTSQYSSSTLESISIDADGSQDVRIAAVEINGVILIDGLGLVLALPLVGGSADVSNQINSSSTTKAITVNGGAVASSLESNFYDGSFLFDGSGDYLNTASSSDFSMGTGDYTVECWVYQTSASSAEDGVFQISTGSSGLNGSNSNTITLQTNSGTYRIYANDTSTAMSTAVITDRWVHLAVVRNFGTTKLYVNGVQDATVISDTRNYSGTYVAIGGYYSSSYLWVGNIQDFRIYKGVAKYTNNFIPAATNPDIIPDTPSGITGQTNLAKITGGAVHFDGTGDYLSFADSDDWFFGSGNFTVEAYIYPTATPNQPVIVGQWSNPYSWCLQLSNDSNRYMRFLLVDDAIRDYVSTTSVPTNRWSHLAVVRNSSTFTFYLNGKAVYTFTNSNSLVNQNEILTIGGLDGGDQPYQGFISNVRVIKGTALYTTDFTPPSAPLTNVTNTKLLTCQTPTHISAAVAPLVSGVNNGTVWSSSITSGSAFRSGYPATNAFNGSAASSISDCAAVDTTQFAFIEFTFGGGIPFTTLQLQCDDNNEGTVVVNGVDITSQLPTGSLTNTTITGVSSPLTSLRLTKTVSGSSSVYFGSITIDGTMLADPLTVSGDAAATNFNPFITDINAVRGQETGYATLNSLNNITEATFADGNLKVTTKNASSHYGTHTSTLPMSSGKHYAEVTVESTQGYPTFGVCDVESTFTDTSWIGSLDTAISYYGNNGKKYANGAGAATYGSSFGAGNTIGIAVDLDNLTVEFFKDGVSQGVITGLTDNTEYFFGGSEFDTGSGVFLWNYGQKPFKFPPPDGFQSLNLASTRPDTVIVRPDNFVGISTWTGDGTNNRVIQAPIDADFAWVKFRNQSYSHSLYDTVRGNNKRLVSNSTDGEATVSFSFLGSKNIQISGASDTSQNDNNEPLVGWFWRAGGNRGTFNVDDVGFASAGDIGFDAGGQNNNAYNRDQTWSNFIEGSIDSSYGSATDLFNGTIPTGTADSVRSTNPGYLILNLSTLNITATTVKLYTYIYATPRTFQVNGVTIDRSQVSGNGDKEFTIPVNGKLNSIAWSYDSGSGPYCYMRAIEVDGKLLVNNGVSPTNVPSVAATGASVGTKQGFSIVKYSVPGSTPYTIPHGLSEAPTFIIWKSLSSSNWVVYHASTGNQSRTYLNLTLAASSAESYLNNTSPSSAAITMGSSGEFTGDMIVYSWHDVPGLQKFGIYSGNSNTNGAFIELGFKPAVLWAKCATGGGGDWIIKDSTRYPANREDIGNTLVANVSNSEDGYYTPNQVQVDLLSNGFKIRHSGGPLNDSGRTYIYCAWAEAPTVNLFGAQSNGR